MYDNLIYHGHRTHCRIAFGVGERRSSHIEPTWACIAALSIQYSNGESGTKKGTGQKDERRKCKARGSGSRWLSYQLRTPDRSASASKAPNGRLISQSELNGLYIYLIRSFISLNYQSQPRFVKKIIIIMIGVLRYVL